MYFENPNRGFMYQSAVQTVPVISQIIPTTSYSFTNVLYSNKKLQNINCIIEANNGMGGLYIGDIISTLKPQILQKEKIKAILSCSRIPNNSRKNLVSEKKNIECQDTLEFPIKRFFAEAYDFIQKNRKNQNNVLVHCHAGVSRSGAIIISYLMKKYNWSALDALQYVKKRRERVKPNENFWKQLVQYQHKILRSQTKVKNQSFGNQNPQIVNEYSKEMDESTQALTDNSNTDSKMKIRNSHISRLEIEQKYFTPIRQSKNKPDFHMSRQLIRNKAYSGYLQQPQQNNFIQPQMNRIPYFQKDTYPVYNNRNPSCNKLLVSEVNMTRNYNFTQNQLYGYKNTYPLSSQQVIVQPIQERMRSYNDGNRRYSVVQFPSHELRR